MSKHSIIKYDTFGAHAASDTYREFLSPSGDIKIAFLITRGELFYHVFFGGEEVIAASRLGLSLEGDDDFLHDFLLVDESQAEHEETWQQPWGETAVVHDRHNEHALYLQEFAGKKRRISIRFRLFDDGVAFRYEIPYQPECKRLEISDELTEFAIPSTATSWWIPAYQPDRYEYLFEKTSVADIPAPVHTPFTVQLHSTAYIAIHEAALYNYGSMTLAPAASGALKADITPLSDRGLKAKVVTPFISPWRVILFAKTAHQLTASTLLLRLNEPSKIADTSWIRPAKFLGIWWGMFVKELTWSQGDAHGATTERAKQYIDECVQLGVEALLIEGWNETWDGNWMENGDRFNFTKAYNDFDIEEVARYARSRGIELIGHHETAGNVANYESQWPAAFEFYKKLGIRYIKLGYVGSQMNHSEYHHSQFGVRHYQKVIELAAEYEMMLDIHEPIKGTGIERTWPNVMTREGARGQEYEGGGLTPAHTAIIPYTRCLAGAFDFTPGIFDLKNAEKPVGTTLAKQLAFYVTIFSPLQMVADRPHLYHSHPAYQFIHSVPTSWDESLPLAGEIGEYYAIARRHSDEWYIGSVTNELSRDLSVNLDFLDENRAYLATIYRDDEDAHWQDNPLAYAIDTQIVASSETLTLRLAPGGGVAIRIIPAATD
ncbi:glycoside hydrolase family 97 protein [Candidatus Saccharibacteria bacterium]|nr:glycoside hydrolase family 97 protein [Candidatus Saccharibacteria bacterium]